MARPLPTLDILISTIDSGIQKIPQMLSDPIEGIRYVVSFQHTSDYVPGIIPAELYSRPDVTVSIIAGKGLSANRNNAIGLSSAEICLIADDDNLYSAEWLQELRTEWASRPETDILTFQAQTIDGTPLHTYPAPYVCSVEISFRRKSIMDHSLRFDCRFGLGSPLLKAGEEDIFLFEARRAGLSFCYVPKVFVRTKENTTADGFAWDRKLQLTKGAVFRYMYGPAKALWLSLKEAGWYFVHRRANPFPIFINMTKGIWILQ